MAGVNKVILVGNLGKDPELRQTKGGKSVCNFSLATTKKTNDGEKTEWHNIILWEKLADIADQYLAKGRQVYLEGEIQSRKYEDANGNDRYITEIVCWQMQMLGSRDETSSGDSAPNQRAANTGAASKPNQRAANTGAASKPSASKSRSTGRSNSMPADDGDDDLPF